jgi:organic radical activating enzyme
MLDGQWPKGGCEYCRDIEQNGGSSDRLLHLSIPDFIPPELTNDPFATVISPRLLEVYLDNVCNMSCLYCWDGFSSKIQQENSKFGRFESYGVVIDNRAQKNLNHQDLKTSFWNWLDKNCQSLERLHILGGEPFYQKDFEVLLSFLENKINPGLEFNVISNLMIDSDKFVSHIQRIKKLVIDKQIKRFDLTASIDCFGAEQEYVRFGLDLDQWRQNFEYLVSQEWIYLNINQTLSGLTIKTVPDLLQYINRMRTTRDIGHYFSITVMTHEFLHPQIFGTGFWNEDFDRIFNNMPSETETQQQALEYMKGISLQINSGARDSNKIHQLGVFLDEIDRRRNLDWRSTFPWLMKELENVV